MALSNKEHHLADCANCPLATYHKSKGNHPIPMEINNPDAPLLILPEPSSRSMELGMPLMGEEGLPILRIIRDMGKSRKDFNYTYAVACRYPAGNSKAFHAQLKSHNKSVKAKTQRKVLRQVIANPEEDEFDIASAYQNEEIQSPVDACSARLHSEIGYFNSVVTMGKTPATAVLSGSPNVEDIRGGPTVGFRRNPDGSASPIKVLPTVDSYYLMAKPSYEAIVKLDLEKALRYHHNELRWQELDIVYDPPVELLVKYLTKWRDNRTPISIDTETDSFEPMTADLRCIGLGVANDKIFVLKYQSVEYDQKVDNYLDLPRCKKYTDALRPFFLDPNTIWSGQNFRVYDYLALEATLGFYPVNVKDNILLAHLADNELPRGLAFWGSILTDVPAWKAEHTAVTAKTDAELHRYCGIDVGVTDIIVHQIVNKANARSQLKLYRKGEKLQDISRGMHKLGMRVDNRRLLWHYYNQDAKRQEALTKIKAVTGPNINVNSNQQLAAFLYEHVGAPVLDWTLAKEPSVNSTTLRKLRANSLVPEEVRHMITSVLNYRTSNKVITTYLKPLSPLGMQVNFDKHTGLGLVHSNYNVTGTTTGRYSSDSPNWQNLPEFLRDIFVAGEEDSDYWFVYYDLDQLELRVLAALADAKMYKRVLQGEPIRGRHFEPHNLTGWLVFGDAYFEKEGAPSDYTKKGSGKFAELRHLIKTIYYLFQYGGGAQTMLEALTKAEKKDGSPLFAEAFTEEGLPKVRALLEKLKKAIPEIPKYWEKCYSDWRKNGFVEDPIWGRRRYFNNGFDPNSIVNHPSQAGGFAIAAEGLFRLEEICPFDFKLGTGLTTQTHDSGVYRVKYNGGEDGKAAFLKPFQDRITSNYLDMEFSGDAKLHKRWVEIEEEWEQPKLDHSSFDMFMSEKPLFEDSDDRIYDVNGSADLSVLDIETRVENLFVTK